MRSFLHFAARFLRGFLGVLVVASVLLAAVVAYLGFTASGNQFLANRVAEQISTPDLQVTLEGARGLLEGRFGLDRVTLSDTSGKFAEVEGLEIFWTPTELLSMRFHAERIAARKISFDRLPVTTTPSEPSDSTFSLPVEIKVDSVGLPSIALDKAVAGRDTELSVDGSAQAVSDRIALVLKAVEKNRPEAIASANLAYSVNARTLTLDGSITEPQGGLLAQRLKLPGAPPVEISVKGEGPLDDWRGSVAGRVGGVDVLALSGSHRLADAGLHRIVLSGGGRLSELMPPAFRPLFVGETRIDIDTLLGENGLVEINSGSIANDSLTLAASGALDPNGEARLTGDLKPVGNALPFELPLGSGWLRADIASVRLTMNGPFRTARIDVDAQLANVSTPDMQAGAMTVNGRSERFDLADRTGVLSFNMSAATLTLSNPGAGKVLQGPLTMKGDVEFAADRIFLSGTEIESPRLGGRLSGSFARADQTASASFSLFLLPQGVLPPDVERKVQGTIGLSGELTATLPGSFALTNLKLASNLLNATGSASYDNEEIKAGISGDIPDFGALEPGVSGPLHFVLDASGPAARPVIAAEITSPEIKAAERLLGDVALKFTGVIDPQMPGGKLAATATLDGQTIHAAADISSKDGLISIPVLKADIGPNVIAGALAFDRALQPTGKIDFDFGDIALLAKLAGQSVQGSLKGAVELSSANGKTSGRLTATGPRLASSGAEFTDVGIDLTIADLVRRQLAGRVTAGRIASGANHLDQVALDAAISGTSVQYTLESRYDEAPLVASGTLDQANGGLAISLSSFSATPRKIPVRLAQPTVIRVVDGAAILSGLMIAAGEGTITVDGAAGKVLDLKATIAGLPLSLANAVSPGLDASGAINGDVIITGDAAKPAITFKADLAGIVTSHMRNAGLPPLQIAARGRFADNLLSLDATSDLRGQPLEASTQVRLGSDGITLPSLRLDIGKSAFSGSLSFDSTFQPSGRIDFDIPDTGALASIVGRKAEGALKGTADIASAAGRITAKVTATGTLRGQAIVLAADVAAENGAVSVPSLKLDVGRNTLTGALSLDPQPSGKFSFDFPDVALLAALVGQKAEGALRGTADVASNAGRIDAKANATGTIRGKDIDISVQAISENGKISLPALTLQVGPNTMSGALTLDQAFMPTGKVSFDLPDIALLAAFAGQQAEGSIKGSADIASRGGKLSGSVSANGTRVVAAGAEIVKPAIDLDIADFVSGQLSGKVAAERITSGANTLSALALVIEHTGNTTGFDLKSQYDGAPMLAKGKVEQGADGITVSLASFSAAPRKIPVKLAGPTRIRIRDGGVTLTDLGISAGKGSITVTGAAGQTLDIKAKITALPASLANSFASGLDAAGTISADVTVTGSSAAPVVAFDTNWQNAATNQTRTAGIGNLSISAKGGLQKNVLSINANARGAGGLSLTAGGTVGLTGNRALAIKVSGKLPFAALAGQLASNGVDLKGNADFNLSVAGTAAAPSITGRITTSGATLTVIRQNLTVNKLSATVELDGKQARIASLKGNLAGGGTVSASGTVGIAPNSGFPAAIRVELRDAVYTDGRVVAAKLTGDITVNGPLLRQPVLSGNIRLRRADITIPEKLPGALSQLDVKHKHAPRDVIVQAAAIRKDLPQKREGRNAGGMLLDLTVSTRQVFVRGRGLDAELGGEVKIAGTSAAPNVSGGFKMKRGRLSIIGRRLDFTSGTITFGGAMMPALDLVASSTVNATTINVTVSGLASNPSVAFSSSPALPQDEVLALLIFGRSSASLSPVQIAQLADAVSTLAGGQSNSLFNRLRQGLGVDDLDVGTDENGKSNVSAGKYLNKRTYIQLQQGVEEGTSKAVINLDIGKGVKVRTEAGTDGSAATGVFFEKEY